MRLSIANDEISNDLTTVLEVLNDQRCKECELRRLGLDSIPTIDERWMDLAEKAVNTKRLRVTSLFTPYLIDIAPDEAALKRLFALCSRLKCDRVSIGSIRRKEDNEEDSKAPDEVVTAIKHFCAEAAKNATEVVVRTIADTYSDVAVDAVELIRSVGAANLGLEWDVGASLAAGDGTGLESIDLILPVLKSIRVRDAVRRGLGAEWVSLGKGIIPWEDILELLYEGGYRGPVILDPGVSPKLRESRAALTVVARWIDACRTRRPDDRL